MLFVERLMQDGTSNVDVGKRLKNGILVGITAERLCLYNSSKNDEGRIKGPDEVNYGNWGGNTTHISGLFLRKKEAIRCFNSEKKSSFDKRWKEQTREVLRAIGENHNTFVISQGVLSMI